MDDETHLILLDGGLEAFKEGSEGLIRGDGLRARIGHHVLALAVTGERAKAAMKSVAMMKHIIRSFLDFVADDVQLKLTGSPAL